MLRLSEMNELAAGARSVGRDPVKTQFTEFERGIVKHFFFSQTKRDPPQARELDSDRMQSFFALCTLLGEPLDASKWPLLENAAKGDVRLDFLVGKDEVVKEEPNDWELKCFGLKEAKPGAEVFVVGPNRIFYENRSLELILSPD